MSTPVPDPVARTEPWPSVSVVMAVLNEERHLAEAVRRILDQDYAGDLEVVIALGPSRDRTALIAGQLSAADARIRTVANPSGRTPDGLNAAIAGSVHPVVVRVDGHGLLASDYIRTAVRTLQETGADNVGGLMAAQGVTGFEKAVAAAMTSVFGVGAARFHTGGEAGPAETVYLGVFRRSVIEQLGGYDPSFTRAQDWELNYRIRRAGGLIWFTPDLAVTYRPRSGFRPLAKQYFEYGRWRRVVTRLHSGTVTLRYLAAPLAVVGIVGGLAGAVVTPWALLLPAGYVAATTGAAIMVGRGLPLSVRLLLPAVFATMHISWGLGFLTSPRRLAARHADADRRPSTGPSGPVTAGTDGIG